VGLQKQVFFQARCPSYHPINSVKANQLNTSNSFADDTVTVADFCIF